MINALNPLNELSDVYLGSIREDNSPEAIKARVMQHVRAIRYRARKEGENLNKAYNEFMGGQSGISSTEKQMVKERLGLTGGSAHVGEETSLADMRKASNLSLSDDPKDQDEARKIKTQMDYESLIKQRGKKLKKEEKSDWRTDLREIASDIPVTEKEADKKIKEKNNINNKVTINPTQAESFANQLGGQLIEMYEIKEVEEKVKPKAKSPAAEEEKDREDDKLFGSPNQKKEPENDKVDPNLGAIESKARRQKQLKKQVLMKKLQAVRSGAGEDIVAHFEPEINAATEYFFEQGVNEDGLDIIIEELGLDDFLEFVSEDVQVLNEERAARRATVRAKSYADVKADIDKKDAAKKASKKGEYAPSYAKKETDVTVYDDKPAAKKKAAPAKKAPVKKAKKDFDGDGKVEAPKQEHRGVRNKKITKAVTKAKIKQPEKKASKQGLADKIRSAYKAGVKRHRKSTQGARVFAKGFASGAKKAVKFAKDVKKVVSEEELLEKDSRRTVDAIRAYDKSKDASRDATADSDEGHPDKAAKERKYAKKERGEIKKDDPNWKHKKYHTGMHGESLELEDANGNLAYEIVDVIKAPTGLKPAQPIPALAALQEGGYATPKKMSEKQKKAKLEAILNRMQQLAKQRKKAGVSEDYEKKKTGEVLSAFKRDPKVRKRFVKAAKKEGGPGSAKNRAADDMLQTAKDIAKRKGDTSKSDDRYAYEQVEVKKNSEIVQELFGLGNKKYPYGKATKKNPRGKRDQAELDRAQEYIKKNPNFGKVSEAKDAALEYVRNKYKGQIYDPKSAKKPSEADKAKVAAERKKRQTADNKAFASRAKKAGYKNPQDYANVVARYGSEDNYNKGKGLGT